MGNKCISAINSSNVPAPTDGTKMSSKEVKDLLHEKFNLDNSKIFVGDRDYLAYSLETLKEFLQADLSNKIKYQSEKLDCDDFARILQGREREWFGRTTVEGCGSTFGCIWGDLRPTEESEEPYYHAMNFFIDSDKKVWMVEPQSDKLREITSNSTHWYAGV
jgi:hypothetical protein